MSKAYLLAVVLLSISFTGCLQENSDLDSDLEVVGSMTASENGSGDWTIQIGEINPEFSVSNVSWYLMDTQGNTTASGSVSDIYGYYDGQGQAVTFTDNDFDGNVSSSDKFGVYPGEGDLASVNDVTDYSFRLMFERTNDDDIISEYWWSIVLTS
tara:strand:+ start:77 stop:541 length:465 start_codon:yes stop_codon:yes gene_type:complete